MSGPRGNDRRGDRRSSQPRDEGGSRRGGSDRDRGGSGSGDKTPGDRKPSGERKASGDRQPSGDRKPYGDRKPSGDRKTYSDRKPSGDRKTYSDRKPSGENKPSGDRKPSSGRTAVGTGADLPKWLREEIVRSTKKDRRDATLNLLSDAAGSFQEGRYPAARKKLIEAKALSSRAGAIRELLALSCYRLGMWQEGLREIRTFRRITGDTTHMAVEMDCLRALERFDDVHTTWDTFQELGGSNAAEAELRVVYGSFLLDQGDNKNAWEVTRPRRLSSDAPEWEVRRWYVAARAAARLGDKATAKQIASAIEEMDPALPGLDTLHDEIA